MEKLEKKTLWPDNERLIMIEKSQFYENERVYQFGYYDGYQRQNDKIKDIAIAFAEYYTQQTEINRIEAERIFQDFIADYYK